MREPRQATEQKKPFETEQLKEIGFSDTDCEAVAVLERALHTGHYPKGTYQPISKPYMINFRKVTSWQALQKRCAVCLICFWENMNCLNSKSKLMWKQSAKKVINILEEYV